MLFILVHVTLIVTYLKFLNFRDFIFCEYFTWTNLPEFCVLALKFVFCGFRFREFKLLVA